MENVTSEQQLQELLEEGKITQAEYEQLLTAMKKSTAGRLQQSSKSKNKYLLLLILAMVIATGGVVLSVILICDKEPVTAQEFLHSFPEKLVKLDIDKANLKKVIQIFGAPEEYIWGNQTFKLKNLPRQYVVIYPCNFCIYMRRDKIVEIRFEGPGTSYAYKNKIKIGSSLDEVFEVIGKPDRIVEGKENMFADEVLYKDIDGREGHCYYARQEEDIRLWFLNYKVKGIYITRSDYGQGI